MERLINPSTKQKQSAKTWIALVVALVIGLVAAFGARQYLSGRMEQIDAEAKSRMTQVVVAKSALQKGEILSADNLAVRSIPLAYTHATAVQPGEFEHIVGERLGYDVESGEAILWGLLETKRAPTFSAKINDGRRAVTVPVDEINSISGLLEPGDTIDLLVSLDHLGRKLAFPLLQAVRVMATGQRSVDDPKTGESREYQTVTLDTTPEEARNLILAREAGRITALLRNPQDTLNAGVQGDLAELLYGVGRSSGTPQRGSRQVPVLYGGGGQIPAEGLRLSLRSEKPPASEGPATGPSADDASDDRTNPQP